MSPNKRSWATDCNGKFIVSAINDIKEMVSDNTKLKQGLQEPWKASKALFFAGYVKWSSVDCKQKEIYTKKIHRKVNIALWKEKREDISEILNNLY